MSKHDSVNFAFEYNILSKLFLVISFHVGAGIFYPFLIGARISVLKQKNSFLLIWKVCLWIVNMFPCIGAAFLHMKVIIGVDSVEQKAFERSTKVTSWQKQYSGRENNS